MGIEIIKPGIHNGCAGFFYGDTVASAFSADVIFFFRQGNSSTFLSPKNSGCIFISF